MNGYYRKARVTFPVTYSKSPSVFTSKVVSSLSALETRLTTGVGGASTTNTDIYVIDTNGAIGSTALSVRWMAIGY